jgi:hypothetical protein
MENDEKKYEYVIKALKGMQKVNAPENFEADLRRRINSKKYAKEDKKSFWQNIFIPSRLIPSLGLVATAVVIFFVVDTNSEEMDNPFLIEPRVREDIFVVTDYDEFEARKEEVSKQKSLKKDKPQKQNESVLGKRRDETTLESSDEDKTIGRLKTSEDEGMLDQTDMLTEEQEITAGTFSAVEESTTALVNGSPQPTAAAENSLEVESGQIITKEELNFRQVQLNEEEQKAVDELKMQVQSSKSVEKSRK